MHVDSTLYTAHAHVYNMIESSIITNKFQLKIIETPWRGYAYDYLQIERIVTPLVDDSVVIYEKIAPNNNAYFVKHICYSNESRCVT